MRGFSCIALLATSCATGSTFTYTRSVMVPLQPIPTAAVAPEQFATLHAGINTLPFGVNSLNTEASGDQVASIQPEGGVLFRLLHGHLLVGGYAFGSSAGWGVKPRADQLSLGGDAMFGVRARIGFALKAESGIGVMGTVEPGFDVLPFADSLSGHTTMSLPEMGTSLTLTYDFGPARFFIGGAVNGFPVMTSSVTVGSSCIGCSGSDGWSYGATVAATTGARVRLTDTLAFAVSVTMPATRDQIGWTPLLTFSVQADLPRPAGPPEPKPVEEPENPPPTPENETPSAPPLIPLEEPQL